TRINAQTGVQISLNKQSGTNTVAVARAVLNEVELINQDISQLEIFPIMDSSVFIRRSINNVGASAILGGLLAIFVLLFFLRNLISTAIISTAIPISIIATFGLLYFSGFTLNIMTLGGLALGVGMLLDNSIVVLENVYRLREIGFNPKEAAVKGTNEVAAPIVASTLTTLVVFLPLIFMQGMSGIMFKQLSFVVAFAIFISMITALTLVPMLSSKLLKYNAPDGEINHRLGRRLFDLVGNLLYSLENKYKNLLHLALNHRLLTVISAVFLLSSSLLLIPMIGRELMPEADEGELRISLEMEPGTRLEVTDAKLKQVETIVKQNVPELKHMIANSGGGAWGAARSHIAFSRLALVPKSERKRSSDDVANMLRPLLNQIPGAKIRVRPVAGMMSFRRMQSGAGRLELSIRGHDLDRAAELALNIQKIVDSVDGVTDSNISRSSGSPEELIIIDRQKAADLKLSVQKIAAMLQTVLSGTRTGYFREDGKEFDIILQLDDKDKTSFDDILNLSIINNAGEPIILKNLVRIERGTGAAQIDRQNQERITTVSANISGRDMGSIIKDIRLRLTELNIPQDFAVVFGGDYEEQKKSNRELMLGFVLALILIYMVMASQYESLKDPFVVMFSVPFAIIGVVLILFLTGTTFNIQSYIGMIMLGGIVVNNAILLVDTTNLLRREEGFSTRSAIEEAGRRRLRPILMTASTTILAMIPMALGIGEGGEAQAPLARAVIGGMLSSALITLVFVPVIYSFFEERRHKIVQ
ncbi:MAG: efflux RND transporter permease subunit, partial [Candidatus Cloacimonetes bacterium]|nr:efflux RND transporter permease subunit [Candidatus Cloacimonadota bacterium]